MKNTIYTKKSDLDQFYTSSEAAKKCYDFLCSKVNINSFDIILEPSAGNGSFYNLFPQKERVGIDLDPKCEGIKNKTFLIMKFQKRK